MPLLGLGTWQLRGRTVVDAVTRAFKVGYRHIDTATMYANEREVGRAVAESGVDRAEIFVTTKLPQKSRRARASDAGGEPRRARRRLRRPVADPLAAGGT